MKKGISLTPIGTAKTNKRGKTRSKYQKLSDATGKYSRVRCSFEGCARGAHAKEYCFGHYQQLRRSKNLTPLAPLRKPNLFMAPLRSKKPNGYDDPSLSQTFPDFPDE
jgi:hypothetical protein